MSKKTKTKKMSVPAKKRAAAKSQRKPGKPGTLKGKILKLLQAAGPKGVTVVSLVPKVGRTRRQVAKWFYWTGANVPGLKRLAPGKYCLTKKK